MQFLDDIDKLVREKFTAQEHLERYQHTLGVVKMAEYLAKLYHVDTFKAKLAAYLHDFCKYDEFSSGQGILNIEDIKECEKYPVLYHSYASAEYYKKNIGNDEEIYQAIRNHVFGRIGMSKLEEIILISDYTEENRTYPNCVKVRETLLKGNFNQAIFQSTYYTIQFLLGKNISPHPLQYEVLKFYEGKCTK